MCNLIKTVQNILTIILVTSVLHACNRQGQTNKSVGQETISILLDSTPKLNSL